LNRAILLNRVVIAAACSLSVAACSLLAPSEGDLLGGEPRAGRNAGGRSSGGSGNGAGTGAKPPSAGASGDAGATGGTTGGGGMGGTSGASGEAGDGGGGDGGGGDGGDGGSGGAEVVCETPCGIDEECTPTPAGPACTCVEGLVRDGAVCRLPRSCSELHRVSPDLRSGVYMLQPLDVANGFESYCGMVNEGGGWTLAVNEGTSFDPTTLGVTAACYASSCTNAAYAHLPLENDVMIDISNAPILNATYTARIIVSGVHAMSRGKTLRTLFTTGPNYIDAEDNSNVAVRMIGGADCSTLPVDMARLVCDECSLAGCKVAVLVFGDFDSAAGCREAGAPVPKFAIGGANAYDSPWTNCAGWPQDPNRAGDFYPDYVRVWIR
jgi:hypothetical protein